MPYVPLAISVASHPAVHCMELDAILPTTTSDVPPCPVDSEVRLNKGPTVGGDVWPMEEAEMGVSLPQEERQI